MTDEPKDGNQAAGGTPTPSVAPGQHSEADLSKVIAEINQRVADHEAKIRAFQSGKDKAVDRAVAEIAPMKDQLARFAEVLGVDPAQVKKAQRTLALDDLADEYLKPQPADEGTPEGASAELQDIVAALDLPANDSRVTNLQLKYGGDPAKFVVEAAKLKKELATAQKEPTPAEQPLPSGGSGNAPETEAQMRARIFGDAVDPFELGRIKQKGGGGVIWNTKTTK